MQQLTFLYICVQLQNQGITIHGILRLWVQVVCGGVSYKNKTK